MAKTGQLLPTAIGTASPNIAKYPQQGGWYPYSVSIVNSLGGGKVKRGNNQPVANVIKGQLLPCYFNDFYFRVHVVPTAIDMGNVVTSQQYEIYVWNAHFINKRLNAITGVTEGIVLEGQSAPAVINALKELLYKITITPEGSSIIDDSIVWDFNEELPSIHITGNRIIAFSFMPNWADSVQERLEWATDILTSETGVEQRSALYVAPRRYFTASFIVHGRERQLFNNMASWHAKNWAMPLWHYIDFIKQPIVSGDTTIHCNTNFIEFKVGGLVFLWRDEFTYEIAEIAAINSDNLQVKRPLQSEWPAGTRVYPAITAIFNNVPSLKRYNDQLQETSIEFRAAEVNSYNAATPSLNYKNYPVFTLLPDESENLTSSYQQILATLDNGMALPLVTDTANNRFIVQGYRFLGFGRAEHAAYRAFLYYLNGQQKAVWIPSHADDLTILGDVSNIDTSLVIAQCGYTRFAQTDTDKKYLFIRLTDGSIYCRTVLSSSNDGDTERLLLDEPFNRAITAKEFERVSYMRLSRLNDDSVTIKHITDSEGAATSSITFKRVLDNEL